MNRSTALATLSRGTLSAVLAGSLTLAGCSGAALTQAGRIGADDGSDTCRQQAAALDSTGNFFASAIITGAAIGGLTGAATGALAGGNLRSAVIGGVAGAVAGGATGYLVSLRQQQQDQASLYRQVNGDLLRENQSIDRTQVAFDQLMDCRFGQAQRIRADYQAKRIDRATADAAMAQVRGLAQRDIALAQTIDGKMRDRGTQFAEAADYVRPGTTAAIASAPPPSRPAAARRATPIRLRPDPSAPEIGQVAARDKVTATRSRDGYTLVQTASGTQGYVATPDILGAPPPTPAPRASRGVATASSGNVSGVGSGGGADEVRTLAGSNAARRDSFSERVAVSEHATQSSFELASG